MTTPLDLDVTRLRLNADEVSSVFTLPIKKLLDPANMSIDSFRNVPNLEIPSWRGPQNERIWGLTAYFLNEALFGVIAPRVSKL